MTALHTEKLFFLNSGLFLPKGPVTNRNCKLNCQGVHMMYKT